MTRVSTRWVAVVHLGRVSLRFGLLAARDVATAGQAQGAQAHHACGVIVDIGVACQRYQVHAQPAQGIYRGHQGHRVGVHLRADIDHHRGVLQPLGGTVSAR